MVNRIVDKCQELTLPLQARGVIPKSMYEWAHQRGLVWEKYFGKKVDSKVALNVCLINYIVNDFSILKQGTNA